MAESIGPLSQIPPGEGRIFVVDGVSIAVFHTRSGGVYATQAYCPHRAGPLADGLIDDATVVCPLHDRIFNLASGEGIGNDCALAVYPASISDNQVLVEVKKMHVDAE